MGLLRSKTYLENITINDVLLGQPTIVKSDGAPFSSGDSMKDLWFAWDDNRIPSGEILEDGIIIPDS